MEHDEPILLVGETGTGKTTVCQLFAEAVGQTLHMINCHQHTETSDFIGGLRPARGRAFQLQALLQRVGALELNVAHVLSGAPSGGDAVPMEIAAGGAASRAKDAAATSGEGGEPSVAELLERVETARAALSAAQDDAHVAALLAEAVELRALGERCNSLFVWQDGPLLTAMRRGELLLIDEISLADDAVREWRHSTVT